ncbi:MAG: serine/threonine-protein phosphatase [Planctomycetia bacterium]|nr:serine/threonine-protein phosphatase [Planctomycetia bacterium]
MTPPGHNPPPAPGSGRFKSPFTDGTRDDRLAWAELCNLQRRILPQIPPAVPGYRLSFAYRPSFVVTGDYHDFFRRPDGHTAAFIGDGSGHGPAASMLMAIMRTMLHTLDIHCEPGDTLSAADSRFHRLIPPDLFMTGVYLVMRMGGQVSWAAAGHHPPLWLDRRGQLHTPDDLGPVGSVLGLGQEQYQTMNWQLEVGDRILLFTDGLWDARSHAGEPFGRERLKEYFSGTLDHNLGDVVDGLVARVTAHLRGADFEDDFTILGIERVT